MDIEVGMGKPKDEKPKSVHIDKIENGFVVRTCGYGKDEAIYVEKLYKTPAVIAKLLGLDSLSPDEAKRKDVKFEHEYKEEAKEEKEDK